MYKKIGGRILFLFLFGFPVLTSASIPGFYVLGQIGSGDTHAEASDAAALSISNKAVLTGRVAGGYRFNQNFATEIGYTRFSGVDFFNVNGISGYNASLRKKAIDFVAKPMLPLSNNFNVYAKLGLAYFKTSGSTFVNGASYLSYSDSWDPVLGLGLGYDIASDVLVDLAWMRLQNTGGKGSIPSADFYSIGLAYCFG